jgi:putative membrane protein
MEEQMPRARATMVKASLMAFLGLVCLSALANAADSLNADAFVAKVAAGNRFEIESSKLALEKSDNAAVRGFAEQMIADHTAAETRLKEVIAEAKVSEPSFALDAKHKEIYEKLNTKSAGDFRSAYIEAQYEAHQETVQMFEAYAATGDDPTVKRFAEHLLPTLRLHLAHITKMWKAGPP